MVKVVKRVREDIVKYNVNIKLEDGLTMRLNVRFVQYETFEYGESVGMLINGVYNQKTGINDFIDIGGDEKYKPGKEKQYITQFIKRLYKVKSIRVYVAS